MRFVINDLTLLKMTTSSDVDFFYFLVQNGSELSFLLRGREGQGKVLQSLKGDQKSSTQNICVCVLCSPIFNSYSVSYELRL